MVKPSLSDFVQAADRTKAERTAAISNYLNISLLFLEMFIDYLKMLTNIGNCRKEAAINLVSAAIPP